MKAGERIEAFKRFGGELRLILDKDGQHRHSGVLDDLSRKAQVANNWFTAENVEHRIREIAAQLEGPTVEKWLSKYQLPDNFTGKRIGVIAAGNIPAAGYDDFMHVLLAGHSYIGKLSADDKILLNYFAELLIEQDGRFASHILFTDGRLGEVDAVIATGSNNSSRYFEYYFSKFPHVIRKNRNSVAVLDGKERVADLKNLGEDVFRYFGLGCRNVTKLYVPEGYRFDAFFEAIFPWGETLLLNRKYMNNYDYNRTIYMLNSEPLLDNNFLVIRRDVGIASPPGVLYFEEYKTLDDVKLRLRTDRELIQCVVTNLSIENSVLPGNAQKPQPWDYADGVDTLQFLLSDWSSSNKQ
jgi:hypothetical protein